MLSAAERFDLIFELNTSKRTKIELGVCREGCRGSFGRRLSLRSLQAEGMNDDFARIKIRVIISQHYLNS